MKTPLLSTQEEDVKKIIYDEDLPNLSEAGTGKTLTSIGAIEKGGYQRQPRVTALLSAGHGVNDAYTAILPALLPLIGLRFGLTETLLALLIATFSFGSSFPAPYLGALSDRVGARLMTAVGIALTAVPLSLVGVAPTAVMLFVLVLLGGLGSAALHPAGSTLARAAGGGGAALAVGLFSAGGMLGFAVGPVLILVLVAQFGLEATPWLMLPGLLAAVMAYAMLPDDRRLAHEEHDVRPRHARLLTGPVGLLTLAGAFAYLPFLAFVSALPLWLVREQGIAPDDALLGATLGVFSVAGAAGGVVTGLLSIRIRREALIAGTMLLAIIPLSGLLYTGADSAAYWPAILLAGALAYAPMPLLVVIAQDLAPRTAAAASGMVTGVSIGLAAFLYIGVGWLQEEIGIGAALMATSLMLLPAAALSYRVVRAQGMSGRTSNTPMEMACACLAAGPHGVPTAGKSVEVLAAPSPYHPNREKHP